MSVVYQNFFPEPQWANPLLREIESEFKRIVEKVGPACILIFEMAWYPRSKQEIEIENAKFPELLFFPKWDCQRAIFQWEMSPPVNDLKFNEKLFRKHILKKAVNIYEIGNYSVSLGITIAGPNKTIESASFKVGS